MINSPIVKHYRDIVQWSAVANFIWYHLCVCVKEIENNIRLIDIIHQNGAMKKLTKPLTIDITKSIRPLAQVLCKTNENVSTSSHC